MRENIYMLADGVIERQIGQKLRRARLRRNYTQQQLAYDAGVSLSTVKKIESGEIGSYDSFIRILRTLRLLNVLTPLLEDDELTPNEYYALKEAAQKKDRHRASRTRRL